MTDPIAPGDLCIVVGAICECTKQDIGCISVVVCIEHAATECLICRAQEPYRLCVEIVSETGRHAWKPIPYVRKIPPLSESEGVDTREVIEA